MWCHRCTCFSTPCKSSSVVYASNDKLDSYTFNYDREKLFILFWDWKLLKNGSKVEDNWKFDYILDSLVFFFSFSKILRSTIRFMQCNHPNTIHTWIYILYCARIVVLRLNSEGFKLFFQVQAWGWLTDPRSSILIPVPPCLRMPFIDSIWLRLMINLKAG